MLNEHSKCQIFKKVIKLRDKVQVESNRNYKETNENNPAIFTNRLPFLAKCVDTILRRALIAALLDSPSILTSSIVEEEVRTVRE